MPCEYGQLSYSTNGICVCVSYHVADPKQAGSTSHQYQSPAELNTPISRDTNMPLKPCRPPDTSALHARTQDRRIHTSITFHFRNKKGQHFCNEVMCGTTVRMINHTLAKLFRAPHQTNSSGVLISRGSQSTLNVFNVSDLKTLGAPVQRDLF